MTPLVASLRDMNWLGRERIVTYGLILLGFETAFMVFVAAQSHGVFGPVPAGSTDFLCFFASGTLANRGQSAAIYNVALLQKMEVQVYGGDDPNVASFFFPYPPTFILICVLLARLPYLVSFYLWATAQLALYLTAIRSILKDWWVAFAMLSCPSAVLNVAIGHNAALTAGLLATATILLETRPILAGTVFGLLCYKPHFLIMVPIALVAGRYWRTLAAMAATGATVTALSWFLFGTDCWAGFFALAASLQPYYESTFGQWAAASLFSGVRVLGGDVAAAYVVQSLGAIGTGGLVAWAWYRRWPFAERVAVLVTAILMSTPVILSYDTLLATIAIAWLAMAARGTGWIGWEKASFAAIWLVMLIGRGMAEKVSIPLLPLIGPCLVVLILRRHHFGHLQRILTSASAR